MALVCENKIVGINMKQKIEINLFANQTNPWQQFKSSNQCHALWCGG